MKILDFEILRSGSYKPIKKTILCVSITVLDRSETSPILTGEKRREIGECIDANSIRQRQRHRHFSIREVLLEKLLNHVQIITTQWLAVTKNPHESL
jgi:hypothetical protein